MTVYRVQVTHVNYWRGTPHRWHSTLHYSITNDATAAGIIPDLYSKLQAMGPTSYPGGIAEIAVYNTSTGGVPIASTVYFPWQTPGSWLPYSGGTVWGTSGTVPTTGEAAAHFKTQAGLSKTGKPVFVGLYWHAFVAPPENSTAQQFTAPIVTAVSALYNALQTVKVAGTAVGVQVTPSGGGIAGTGTLVTYVNNHQRTRGRRRAAGTTLTGPTGKISFSDLVQDVRIAIQSAGEE